MRGGPLNTHRIKTPREERNLSDVHTLEGLGQPNPAFNHQRNRRQEMKSMIGLLDGAVADMRLREIEAAFLDTWLRDNHHLSGDHDARDVKLTRIDTNVASLR